MTVLNEVASLVIVVFTALTGILTFVEKSQKIKSKPLSKLLYGDMEEKIDKITSTQNELKESISEMQKTVDFNDIDTVRSRILANETLLKEGQVFERHQWESLYKDIDKWDNYHKKYPELNGIIKVAIENINDHYKKQS